MIFRTRPYPIYFIEGEYGNVYNILKRLSNSLIDKLYEIYSNFV